MAKKERIDIYIMATMSARELQKKLEANEELHIIDVREVDEVASGMIPGAKNIPLSQIGEECTQLDKDTEYIVVCQAGGRSAHAKRFLDGEGYKIINMVDGMAGWRGQVK